MLFDRADDETDHRYYRNLSKPDFRPDITAWCEATFEHAQMLLDDDFPARFRRETPQRISELLFAAAFLDAGWEPLGRVQGFDLAFKLGDWLRLPLQPPIRQIRGPRKRGTATGHGQSQHARPAPSPRHAGLDPRSPGRRARISAQPRGLTRSTRAKAPDYFAGLRGLISSARTANVQLDMIRGAAKPSRSARPLAVGGSGVKAKQFSTQRRCIIG